MDMTYKNWKAVTAWWAKLPKQKWIAVGIMAIMLMAAGAKVFGSERLWISGSSGIVLSCDAKANTDGIHVCYETNTLQRGYCLVLPEDRFSNSLSDYWCTGNQPGNKTYDKATLVKALIDDPAVSLADIEAAATKWDIDHPVEVSGG